MTPVRDSGSTPARLDYSPTCFSVRPDAGQKKPTTLLGDYENGPTLRLGDVGAILAVTMTEDGLGAEPEYSSRPELNRRLLAVAFAAFLFGVFAHVASYSAFVVLASRTAQNLITWVLVGMLLWTVLGDRGADGAVPDIPRPWSAAAWIGWWYAILLILFSPGSGLGHFWPGVARRLGLYGDSVLEHARTSSAAQSAAAFNLLIVLWFRATSPKASAETFKPAICGSRQLRLALFGVALPLGILLVCSALPQRGSDRPDLIQWVTIGSGFWFTLGCLVTGISVIRDALHRDV